MTSMASAATSILVGILLLLLPGLCLAESEPSFQKLSKSKVVSPAVDFLQNFTIPVPASSYNVSGKEYDDFDIYWLHQYKSAIKSWLDFFTDFNLTNADLTNPDYSICPTNLTADITNNDTCTNGSFVSQSYYVINDLSYYLPHDACDFEKDANCTAWMASVMAPINKTGQVVEELYKQQVIAERNQTRSYYRLIGDYIGVGFKINETCRANINMVLDAVDKYDEAGWSAATTLTALIPALLTIGNLFVPRSSEVFATSFLVGIMSAMFSLGLPVRSISGVPTDQRADTTLFSFKARTWLTRLGKAKSRAVDLSKDAANECVKLVTLQRWSSDYNELDTDIWTEELERTDAAFSKIKQRAKDWQKRVHLWQIPSLVVASSQVVLFLLAIGPLFMSYGTPLLLFDCKNAWTSAWLLIAAGISAIFRFIMWEKGVHERVKMYALSGTAVNNFRRFAESSWLRPDGTRYAHVETDLPPLYPPLLNAVGSKMRQPWVAVKQTLSNTSHTLGSKKSSLLNGEEVGFFSGILHKIRLLWEAFVGNITNPVPFLKGGLKVNSAPEAARRWRPLIVLMHLSTDGRNPLVTLFTGLIEGFVLLLLTVFFAAQWGGNLFIMCYTTAVLLVSITIGRALGLFYVMHSAHSYGLHVIETQDHKELRGCLRILCSMQEVLIYVNGAWFFEGHRLDVRPGWTAFQRCYNLGHLDSDHDMNTRCNCHHTAFSGTPSLLPTATFGSINKPLPTPIVRPASTISIQSNASRRSSQGSALYARPSFNNTSAIQLVPVGAQRQSTGNGPSIFPDPAVHARPAMPQRRVTEPAHAITID